MAAYPKDNRISARAVLTQGIEAALNATSDHKELRAAPIDGPARATSSNGRPQAAGLAEAVQLELSQFARTPTWTAVRALVRCCWISRGAHAGNLDRKAMSHRFSQSVEYYSIAVGW